MRRWLNISLFLIAFIIILLPVPAAYPWGYHEHKKINHAAVYALPQPLEGFYKRNIDYIVAHSVDPDKHKYVDSTEAHRHFIDIDHYGNSAFDILPEYWRAAVEKFSKDTLEKYGTLPWEVLYWESKLTEAFKNKDVQEILKASAYIGHYMADAHVPLHTISNYNGQKTEQQGIHALWETAIPEAYQDKYNYLVGKATYLKNPENKIWEIIKQSHALASTVLEAEKTTSENFHGAKYSDTTKKQYTSAYVAAYNKALNGMVEKQARASVLDIAAFWYTAWVNAGQPDLTGLKTQ